VNQAQLHIVPPSATVAIVEPPDVRPWWEAPEFLALTELRLVIAGGSIPQRLPESAEESARQAVFWALFEIDHLVRQFARRLEAGESVHMRRGIYKHHEARVDFDLRIVEHPPVDIQGQPPRGAR
jgi:hypothetical protein